MQPDRQGRISASLPKLPDGIYTLEVAAYNDAGESPSIPGDPSRFKVENPKSAESPPTPAAQPAPQPVPAAGATPPSTKETKETAKEQERKRKPLGRLWKIIVGDDEKEGAN